MFNLRLNPRNRQLVLADMCSQDEPAGAFAFGGHSDSVVVILTKVGIQGRQV
jgi:hypothetical protein